MSTTITANNDMRYGILAVGAYLPRLRLDRAAVAECHRWMAPGLKRLGRGTRTMANWDEDAVTMAVEACRDALANGPVPSLRGMVLASTSLPFTDRLNSGIVRSALALPVEMQASDAGGSIRAGTSELLRALQSDSDKATLVVASEHRQAKPASASELIFGDGAAATVVGPGEPLAVLLGAASECHDFVDHFRETGRNADYGWEDRWIREEGFGKIIPPVVDKALAASGCSAAEIDHFLMPAVMPRVNQWIAKKLGIRTEAVADPLFEVCGDTGNAHPMLMLANVLTKAGPKQKILVLQFGGGCDALVLETTEKQKPRTSPPDWIISGRTESNYMKFLSFKGQLGLEWGMRAEMDNKTALSAAWRSESLIQGFTGGRCKSCETVQFPVGRMCVNPDCQEVDTMEPHRMCDEAAHIRSYTCDWLSYKQCPPFQFGHVEFTSGARVLMEFTDSDPDDLAVGMPLSMVFRIKEVDSLRGFRRYFWKARAQKQLAEVM